MQRDDRVETTGERPSRRTLLAATGGLAATVLAGCLGGDSGNGGATTTDDGDDAMTSGEGGGSTAADDGGDPAWRTTELTTVRGEETFTVDGLEPPVVVQSFAVWCPKCERQSEALARLGGEATVVGLNTDPNEDTGKVRQHAEDNGFEWRFAVAPTDMTGSLVDAFGTTVTNAPSTPLIVACGDGTGEFDAGGVRSADEVRSMADGC
jgi:thiol-disulfide isomerase/thioredoxin